MTQILGICHRERFPADVQGQPERLAAFGLETTCTDTWFMEPMAGCF